MKKLTLLIICFLQLEFFAQDISLSILTVPPELTKNANAVIRESYTEINLEDSDKMTVYKKRVVTVFNKEGNKAINTSVQYDNDTKITELSARIYNQLGEEIKKYSKGKFIDVSAVSGSTLYSDDRAKYIDYTPTNYPYTIEFISKKTTSSTAFIPVWYPVNNFYVSTQKSEYKIINPKNLIIRKKEKNFSNYPIEKVSEDQIHYKITNQAAVNYERNSVGFSELFPSLKVTLNNFSLNKVTGNYSNWEEFGKWMYNKLLLNRNKLNQATISKIKDLVKNASSDLEKAKIVYQFVQNKTRYINVSIGIGGWQPIPADQVDELGYGDCKGLTNYTKALLDAVGIKSFHTIVYGNYKRDIDKNFSSLQGNHMILNIPSENGEDTWLECTSQTMPFGFLGDFTDDRNVLVITPEGGIIKRTPAYKNDFNLQHISANVTLNSNGSLAAKIDITSKGIQYDTKQVLDNKSESDLEKYYLSNLWDYNNNMVINKIDINNNKDEIIFKEKLDVSINDYATVNENELLFRVNIFNKNSYIPKRYRKRKLPLKVDRGFKDTDTYTITIPEGYIIHQLPETKTINNKFGEYKVSITKIDDNTLKYNKSILIKEGTYPKEDYKLYRKFRKSIAKLENARIAIYKN
ncbi:DUF3857 domain-containing protein [Tenacibaculum jejuense]|uniref:DUF3857 domain-containing protein n=1 Tax=Tenacibaculum jejuense TaxID=584609 RepID=A0A238U8A7_9FLAO|nr:DUF3857 domain-containing protein [Tenacibaculum jejuense]SNR14640.1 conserved protein of unknown function [Tenacibaculum jejuense]